MNVNLYWPVYQNLEREVISLANEIHFDDTQLNVYSVKMLSCCYVVLLKLNPLQKNCIRKKAEI